MNLKPNFLDKAVAVFSPTVALRRMVDREKMKMFIYEGARNNRSRQGPQLLQGSESSRNQFDRIQLMKNARELAENTGFVKSILLKMTTYVCGDIRYQAKTGNTKIDSQYEDYFESWSRNCDLTGRHTFRELVQLAMMSTIRDGDMGFKIRRINDQFKLQSIEADRIGGPFAVMATSNYYSGITLDDDGVPLSYRIYERTPNNTYPKFQEVPAVEFVHFFDPFRLDQYRGVTAFHASITTIRDIHEILEFEKMAVKWGSSKAGIITSQTGADDSNVNFDTTQQDAVGNTMQVESMEPGAVTRLASGEDMKLFENNRPSTTFAGFLETLYREIALSLNLPYGFVYDLSNLAGPAARLESAQAQRCFHRWQMLLKDKLLDRVKNLILLNGISNGEIPKIKSWMNGKWLFPAHPTIDVGRESAANLNENRQGLKSAAKIFGEQGEDVEDELRQIAKEARLKLDLAKEYDVPVTMISLPTSNVPADVLTLDSSQPPEQQNATSSTVKKRKAK